MIKPLQTLLLLAFIYSCAGHQMQGVRNPAQVDPGTENSEYDSLLSEWHPVQESFWERMRSESSTGFYDNSKHPAVYDLLNKAKKSIDIEIYEMKDKTFRKLIIEALDRGVKVRIVKDSNTVGDTCYELDAPEEGDTNDCKDEKEYISLIQQKGAQYVFFDKRQLCGISGRSCFQHGKMIIVDRRYVLMSTGNFNSSSLCSDESAKCNRDYSYVTKNSVVIRKLSELFESDLKNERWDFKKIISEMPNSLTVSPNSSPRLVALIKSAKESIWVQNQYLEEPSINQALIEKAKEGIKVHVQVSAFCSFGYPSEGKKLKINKIYSEFDEAGIQTKIFTAKIKVKNRPGYLHSKAIVVDENFGWIGSINGSDTSTLQNREFGIIFNAKKSVHELLETLKDDFNHPEASSWQDSVSCQSK